MALGASDGKIALLSLPPGMFTILFYLGYISALKNWPYFY